MSKIQSNVTKFVLCSGILLCGSFVLAAGSDDHGYIWTPDGTYENGGFLAELNTSIKNGSLHAGNACILSGKLAQMQNKPIYTITIDGGDGVGCPDVSTVTITIIDGPAVRAKGNASRIKIMHKAQKRRVNFSGLYDYKY